MGKMLALIIIFSCAFMVISEGKTAVTNKLNRNVDIDCNQPYSIPEPDKYTITPPGHPRDYLNNLVCTWKITAPEGKVIHVKLGGYDIEESDNCWNDYLLINDSRLCGRTENTDQFITEGNELEIKFVSDFALSGLGFEVFYEFINECSSGYTHQLQWNKCYRNEDTLTKTWDEARADCRNTTGGDLIQMTDNFMNIFVASQVQNSTWLGARRYDQNDTANFVWVSTNTSVWDYYTGWDSGEPNNNQQNEECVEMFYDKYSYRKAWNDAPCGNKYHYICEHPL